MNAPLNLLIEQQWDSNVVCLWPIRTHDILQRQDTLGKGKLRSTAGGAIYADVIWPGMKWKYAIGFNPNVDIWNVVVVDSENGLHAAPNSNSMLQAKYAENICERN